MPFLPETPNWLVANDKKEEAYKVKSQVVDYSPIISHSKVVTNQSTKWLTLLIDYFQSLRWLRGKDHDIQGEINALSKVSGAKTSDVQNSDKHGMFKNKCIT